MSEEWCPVSPEWLRYTEIPFKNVRVSRMVRQREQFEPTVAGQPESALIEHEQYEVEPRAYVAEELRRRAKRIETMRWRTEKEFRKDYDEGNATCPQCGSSKDFDID
jgi:flagellar biosynthesis/type III secretory pathway protein FliH